MSLVAAPNLHKPATEPHPGYTGCLPVAPSRGL